jgi:hypothetical protein
MKLERNTSFSLLRLEKVSGFRRQEVRGISSNEKRHDLYSLAKYRVIKPMRIRLAGHVAYASQTEKLKYSV